MLLVFVEADEGIISLVTCIAYSQPSLWKLTVLATTIAVKVGALPQRVLLLIGRRVWVAAA